MVNPSAKKVLPVTDEELRAAVLWFHAHSVVEHEVRVGDRYETRTYHLAPVV
jgi:hypothetical protein